MLNFMAWQVTSAMDLLYHSEAEALQAMHNGEHAVPPHRITGRMVPAVDYCIAQARQYEFEATLARAGRVRQELSVGILWSQLRDSFRVLRETLQDDLTFRDFAYVPKGRCDILRSLERDWAIIWGQFPHVEYESTEAVECYVLDRNTACVFHLMRVAEHGLRALAREQGVIKVPKQGHKHGPPKWKPIEWAQWQEILGELTKKADALAQKPVSAARDLALGFYRGALGEFAGFKDDYRNHVMHARKQYDDLEALRVLRKVHDFMDRLAKRTDSKGRKINWARMAKDGAA